MRWFRVHPPVRAGDRVPERRRGGVHRHAPLLAVGRDVPSPFHPSVPRASQPFRSSRTRAHFSLARPPARVTRVDARAADPVHGRDTRSALGRARSTSSESGGCETTRGASSGWTPVNYGLPGRRRGRLRLPTRRTTHSNTRRRSSGDASCTGPPTRGKERVCREAASRRVPSSSPRPANGGSGVVRVPYKLIG